MDEPMFDTFEEMMQAQHELCVARDKFLTEEIERKRTTEK